jgi:hypothetical protein
MTLETPEGPQLTIGGLITQLRAFPGDREVLLAGFGNAGVPGHLRRHRTDRNDVTIEASYNPFDPCPVAQLIAMLISHANQPATGSNPDPATFDSPVWVAEHTEGTVSFKAAVRVDSFSGRPVIRWVDAAPVQGPALQRVPDAEVLRRNAELADRGDANLDPETEGNRWLLKHIPKERDRTRLRLSEARIEREKLTREIADLEAESARYDYTLGLTDVNPGHPERAQS